MYESNRYRITGARLLALAIATALSAPALAQTEAEDHAEEVML